MEKWNYKAYSVSEGDKESSADNFMGVKKIDEFLNSMGEKGWEFCGIYDWSSKEQLKQIVILKRHRTSEAS